MSDIVFETFDATKPKYAKTNFLDLTFGIHQVRLLGSPKRVFVHYYKAKGSVQCLGSECPICKVNKALKAEYPEDFRSQPSYNAPSPRHYINVLDRTPVKVCTNTECMYENKLELGGHWGAACSKCGTFLGDAPITLSDKVKVANISETNAEKLMLFATSVRDEDDNPVGLRNFDIEFIVTSSKSKKDISVQVSSKKNARDVVEVPEEMLFDLEKVVIKLEPQELLQFMKGVSLKDIFAARKAVQPKEDQVGVEQDIIKSIEEQLGFLDQ